MHETAICQSLIRQLQDLATEHAARRLRSVTVEIGPLSGVEPPLLRRAFGLASPGTVADGAELIIRSAPVRVRCGLCAAESTVRVNRLVCAACGHWQTRVIAGDELFLREVALDKDPEENPAHVH